MLKYCMSNLFLIGKDQRLKDCVQVQGFKQYVEQYTKDLLGPDDEPVKVAFEQVNPRWEIALVVSDKGFQQVSFVNSIATTKVGLVFCLNLSKDVDG